MQLRWVALTISLLILLFVAVSLYTRTLAQRLLRQQITLVHLYADALRYAAEAPEECLADFLWEYLFPDQRSGSTLFLVPLVLTDEKGKVKSHNLQDIQKKVPNSDELSAYLPLLGTDTTLFPPVRVAFGSGRYLVIYYGEPLILRQLRWMPLISTLLIGIAALIWVIFLYTAHRYRQDKLWVGLARETAHQLGTPLSGLVGAVEMLKESPELLPKMLPRMEVDLHRLDEISERFSKIGADPQLRPCSVTSIVEEVIAYFRHKLPPTVQLHFIPSEGSPPVLAVNPTLLKWVIENLIRNSLDALPEGSGTITVRLTLRRRKLWIDVEDTGRGIPAVQWEAIFRPGFSTKARGWGIGLSLARRVIEDYHGGEIYVQHSSLGQGTVIRVELPLEGKTSLLRRVWRAIRQRLRRLERRPKLAPSSVS